MIRRAAVLGSPIRHSLSPVLHSAAYRVLGLDWAYAAIECDEAGLPGFVDGLDASWAGLSLTMPLKRVALDVADTVSPLAAAVGAANTLLLGGRRHAENTDVTGIAAALRSTGMSRVDGAVVLGAGGTAQAAIAALAELGCAEPVVLVRDPSRAGELRAAAERLGVRPDVRGGPPDSAVPAADVVISTLPAGAADALRCSARVVLDVIYAPWPTRFAVAAAEAGCRTVGGREVLLHQAVAQVELMTGRPGPVDAMRSALEEAADMRP
jgi:shikimate dehydrogenase